MLQLLVCVTAGLLVLCMLNKKQEKYLREDDDRVVHQVGRWWPVGADRVAWGDRLFFLIARTIILVYDVSDDQFVS